MVSQPYQVNYNGTSSSVVIISTSGSCIPDNVLMSNSTSVVIPPPSNLGTIFTAINVSVDSSDPTNTSAYMNLPYSCDWSASSVYPVQYVGGTWNEITPYTVNPATCTVSFPLAADPIVAAYHYKLPPTTTIPSQPSTAASSSGGGIPPQPSIKLQNNCVIAAGISQYTTFNFKVNNVTLTFNERTISQTGATVVINGKTYVLSLNTPVYTNNASIYLELKSVSTNYPLTATIQACSSGPSSVVQLFGTSYLPVYTSVQSGQTVMSQLNLENTGNNPEYIGIKTPQGSQIISTASASTLYLQPGQTAAVQLELGSTPGASSGLYFIPVNITATTSQGLIGSETEYLGLDIYGAQYLAPYTSTQLQLINNSQALSGVIQIHSPRNQSLKNVTLKTSLPPSITANISQIKAYGLPNNITEENGTFVISWFIDYLPANQSTFAYYSINRYQSAPNVEYIQNLFSPVSAPVSRSTISIISISIPPFYTDSVNRITVHALYSGNATKAVTFKLNSPPGVTVYNAIQVVSAAPQSEMNGTFEVATGNSTGTLQLSLSISTPGANLTYPMPVFVLKQPQLTLSLPIPSSVMQYALPAGAAVVAVIIIALVIRHLLNARRRRRNESKVNNLKSQIERGEASEKSKNRKET